MKNGNRYKDKIDANLWKYGYASFTKINATRDIKKITNCYPNYEPLFWIKVEQFQKLNIMLTSNYLRENLDFLTESNLILMWITILGELIIKIITE